MYGDRNRITNGFFFSFFVVVSSVMALTATGLYKGYDRAFCVRMKSTLTKRGCHFKSSGYRVSRTLTRLTTLTAHTITR